MFPAIMYYCTWKNIKYKKSKTMISTLKNRPIDVEHPKWLQVFSTLPFAMLFQFTSKRVSNKQEKETCDSLQRNLCIFQKIINFHALLLLSFFATSETSREFHTFTNLQFACRRELEKSERSPLYLCQKNCVQIAIVKITSDV